MIRKYLGDISLTILLFLFSFASNLGYSSHLHNPFLALVSPETTESRGDAWGFNLVYTGSFAAEVEKSSQGLTRASIGLNPYQFSWPLKPGESISSPECVSVYSPGGVGGMSRDLMHLLGQLRFRTSYSQNVLAHSIETGKLAGLMAEELGLDAALARRAGLLHDIGKAADAADDQPHAQVGADLAAAHGESAAVCAAIASHHGESEAGSPEAQLVAAADALSAGRPGARRDNLADYLRRLERLEELAVGFEGVERAYAIQAGREVRVLVRPEQVGEGATQQLAGDLARRIETDLEYPGQVKVTVIREQRATDYAR